MEHIWEVGHIAAQIYIYKSGAHWGRGHIGAHIHISKSGARIQMLPKDVGMSSRHNWTQMIRSKIKFCL